MEAVKKDKKSEDSKRIIYCPNCYIRIFDSDEICPNCNEILAVCLKCGEVVLDFEEKCSNCGVEFEPEICWFCKSYPAVHKVAAKVEISNKDIVDSDKLSSSKRFIVKVPRCIKCNSIHLKLDILLNIAILLSFSAFWVSFYFVRGNIPTWDFIQKYTFDIYLYKIFTYAMIVIIPLWAMTILLFLKIKSRTMTKSYKLKHPYVLKLKAEGHNT